MKKFIIPAVIVTVAGVAIVAATIIYNVRASNE